MARTSSTHSPRTDEQLKQEEHALLHGNPDEGRTEGRRTETPGPGDEASVGVRPEVAERVGGAPSQHDLDEQAELSTYLPPSVFPAARDRLVEEAEDASRTRISWRRCVSARRYLRHRRRRVGDAAWTRHAGVLNPADNTGPHNMPWTPDWRARAEDSWRVLGLGLLATAIFLLALRLRLVVLPLLAGAMIAVLAAPLADRMRRRRVPSPLAALLGVMTLLLATTARLGDDDPGRRFRRDPRG